MEWSPLRNKRVFLKVGFYWKEWGGWFLSFKDGILNLGPFGAWWAFGDVAAAISTIPKEDW